MWSDKVKAIGMGIGILIIVFLVWQWQASKITPEEIAATEAMKAKISELSKKNEAIKIEKEKKIAGLQAEKTSLAEKSAKLEKELGGREKYYEEILKAKTTGDCEEVISQADLCWKAKEAGEELRRNVESQLAEMTGLYKNSDKNYQVLNEQMRIQLQATQDCQEKKSKGSFLVWGIFGGYDPFTGRMTAGIGAMLALGEL